MVSTANICMGWDVWYGIRGGIILLVGFVTAVIWEKVGGAIHKWLSTDHLEKPPDPLEKSAYETPDETAYREWWQQYSEEADLRVEKALSAIEDRDPFFLDGPYEEEVLAAANVGNPKREWLIRRYSSCFWPLPDQQTVDAVMYGQGW